MSTVGSLPSTPARKTHHRKASRHQGTTKERKRSWGFTAAAGAVPTTEVASAGQTTAVMSVVLQEPLEANTAEASGLQDTCPGRSHIACSPYLETACLVGSDPCWIAADGELGIVKGGGPETAWYIHRSRGEEPDYSVTT